MFIFYIIKMTLYKSFDTSQFLFEILWKEFPNIVTEWDGDSKIVNRLVMTSKEFCDLKSEKKINIKYFSEGGFGAIGKLTMDGKPIKAAVFSLSRNGKGDVFYADMVVKIGKQKLKAKIYRRSQNIISVTDPVSDMVFGSALGHLYDIGVCPFITKYFGTYFCTDNETGMAIETAHFELRNKLDRFRNERIGAKDLKNVMFQFYYCLFILKAYYGMVHFDSHLRNIMLLDLSKDYMYHGKKMSDVDIILMETNLKNEAGNYIVIGIEKSKYMIKLIDYGCMLMCFDRSGLARLRRDLRVETDFKDITNIGAAQALIESHRSLPFANTCDLMFTMINIYEYLQVGLDRESATEDLNAPRHNKDHIAVIDEMTKNTIGTTMKTFLDRNANLRVQRTIYGNFDWFMRNRAAGIHDDAYSNPSFILNALIKSCTRKITYPKFPFENTKLHEREVDVVYFEDGVSKALKTPGFEKRALFLTHNASDYERTFNRFENILKQEDNCAKYKNSSCDIVKLYNAQSPEETLLPKKNLRTTPNFSLVTSDFTSRETPQYKDYNSWLNANRIPSYKRNTSIEDLKVKFLEVSNSLRTSLRLNTSMTNTPGLSVPVGVDVVFDGIVQPLGFTASSSGVKHNFYAKNYEPYLGVVTGLAEGGIAVEKYEAFMARHKTTTTEVFINETAKVETSTPVLPVELLEGSPYRWAVTCGPMLVWESKVVFDKKVAAEKSDEILHGNASRNIFAGGGPGYYGMTDSLELQTQMVLMGRKNRVGIVMVEGGGFSTVGLDRLETAKLCRNLGAEFAVVLQSGYSANALLDDEGSKRFVMKSPVRRIHGAVVHFEWKK